MPTIYDLKPSFQRLLRPVCDGLARHGITPNQLTVGTTLMSLAQGLWLTLAPGARLPLLILPLVLFVRMGLNAIDGMLAKENGLQSRLGALLNEVGDAVSDTVLYLPFALIPGVNPVLVVLLVITGILVEMTGVATVQIGSSRRYDGPLGKSDRAFLFGCIAFVLGVGVKPGIWIDVILTVGLLLSFYTIYNRVRRGLQENT
jgi:CDP-diacylglycerol--glycerol-3-phosphate 3-phosphatidyltransferase